MTEILSTIPQQMDKYIIFFDRIKYLIMLNNKVTVDQRFFFQKWLDSSHIGE